MNKYTVILLLPESMTDGEMKTYTAVVEADYPHVAVMRAQKRAADAFPYCDLKPYDLKAIGVVKMKDSVEPTEQDCKLCLIERVSEFAFENIESYRNDTTGVAADLSYLLWAIAADTSFLWGNEAPDGLIKLLLEHDTELLKELMDKGYIVKEMLPPRYQPDPKRHLAEVAAVVACTATANEYKLGGEGLIAHYSAIADIALAFDATYPCDYDWEAHMDGGGDCWDIEVDAFFDDWLGEHPELIGSWD